MAPLKLILYLICLTTVCECANILYVHPYTSKSHYIMLKPIGLELARRGHNVTVITAYREKRPPLNYHQVVVDDKQIWDLIGIERPNKFKIVHKMSTEEFYKHILWKGGLINTEIALNSTKVQDFLAQDNSFDLIISEQFFQEALYILAHKYKAPLVLVSTFGNCMRHNLVTRNPLQLATTVSEYLQLKEPTSFWARLRNLYFTVYEYIYWRYFYLEEQEALVKKYIRNLPEPVPKLYEMQKNVSLLLINGHFSFDAAVAYLPNIVEVGGVHLYESDMEMPHDLQKLLDKSTDGVVYMNFGSNVLSSELPAEKRNDFLNVFRHLKHTVLWKWEDDHLPNKPDNVVVRDWLPQMEILSHPNTKVFISHGGLVSTQEAIFYGIPIIGMPVFADQYNNLLQVENLGFGRIIQYNDINEQSLLNLLQEFLSNDTYKRNAVKLSALFKDRPISPMDSAMYWIEYVIRHKGANFMRNPALELSWMAYTMLDVFAFIVAAILFTAYALYNAAKLINLIRNMNTKIIKKKHQ